MMLPPRNFENMLILPSILAFGSQLITKCYSLNMQYHLSFVVLFGKVLHIVGGRVLMKEVTGGCSLFIEWTHLSSTCQILFKYMEPTNHGLNLLKPLDKINSFKLFPVFFHSYAKLANIPILINSASLTILVVKVLSLSISNLHQHCLKVQ